MHGLRDAGVGGLGVRIIPRAREGEGARDAFYTWTIAAPLHGLGIQNSSVEAVIKHNFTRT